MFEIGQWIYGIKVIENYFNEAEVSGYLYMGECGDYIICCSEYMHHEGDFESQLVEMYEESIDDYSVDLNLLKKEYVFDSLEKAQKKLEDLKQEYC